MAVRNPFRLRAEQHIIQIDTFVRLFAPGVLELLPEGDPLWNQLLVLRSAPGAGKTSLFRMMTPDALQAASALRGQERFRDVVDHLSKMGALDETGPTVIGIFLPLARDYQTLAEMAVSDGGHSHVFVALLNARIVIATLRAVCGMARIRFPDDLASLRIHADAGDTGPIPPNATGAELYDWASEIEGRILDLLDSFDANPSPGIDLHTGLAALAWLASAEVIGPKGVLSHKRLLMIDDLQELGQGQRRTLLDTLVAFRKPLGLWVAERLEALASEDLLSLGARDERDYAAFIHVEKAFQGARFKKFALEIADLRAAEAIGFEARVFSPFLADNLIAGEWLDQFAQAEDEIRSRCEELNGQDPRYKEWLAERQRTEGNARDRAIAWRSLQILIERDKARAQGVLDFDVLTHADLEDREGSDVRNAAELFLSQEIGAPYYFGAERLANLASANVDQFIGLAGDLFEEIISAAVIRQQSIQLSPERQQAILTRAVEARWRAIPQGVAEGYSAVRLLEAIGTFCGEETYQPNAPYAPGVTGVGITMSERGALIDAHQSDPQSPLGKLARVLGACVAQNLLEIRPDHKNKGQHWMLFHLNRMLCLKFALPLTYGGWRPIKLHKLVGWMDKGADAAKQRRLV